MRRDLRGSRNFGQAEIKRHRQGLRVDEMSSTDVLDVTVFNLGNLARQSVQRQGRTEDVAPHHEPDIAHHDAC